MLWSSNAIAAGSEKSVLTGTVSGLQNDSFTLTTKDGQKFTISTEKIEQEKSKSLKEKNKIQQKVKKEKTVKNKSSIARSSVQLNKITIPKLQNRAKKDANKAVKKGHESRDAITNGATVIVNVEGTGASLTAKRMRLMPEHKAMETKKPDMSKLLKQIKPNPTQ